MKIGKLFCFFQEKLFTLNKSNKHIRIWKRNEFTNYLDAAY